MSVCQSCGVRLIKIPSAMQPKADETCNYCRIADLEAQVAILTEQRQQHELDAVCWASDKIKLTAERDLARTTANDWQDKVARLTAERDNLKALNRKMNEKHYDHIGQAAQLRSALEQVKADCEADTNPDAEPWYQDIHKPYHYVNEALATDAGRLGMAAMRVAVLAMEFRDDKEATSKQQWKMAAEYTVALDAFRTAFRAAKGAPNG